jgi:16S rRNA (uracil1498-N3)-methyltransferase
MSKSRRFRVDSLEGVRAGDALILPPDEVKHARVLRLNAGAEIALFDDAGRAATAVLAAAGGELAARIVIFAAPVVKRNPLTLATAWPKGKRAAVMIEKCCELGLDRLIPVHFERSVVTKDDETEGLVRLRRVAAEAAKQSGRNDALVISAEQEFKTVLAQETSTSVSLIAHPRSERSLAALLKEHSAEFRTQPILIYVGPEGGFTDSELEAARQMGVRQISLAKNVLRVETASIAACAITRAVLETC